MRVLAIAAHPDDELLGLGGTLARHSDDGDEVVCVVASEGATTRYGADAVSELQTFGQKAARILGAKDLRFLGLPDQKLDAEPILSIIQAIESVVEEVRPDVVYSHHWGDVNRDHRVISEAVMVACRPIGEHFPRSVYLFETPSSTEWSWPDPNSAFVPCHFVDVSATIDRKLEAMACYMSEVRSPPHPRSLEALRSRAAYWGQVITRPYAEPFVVARQVR